MVSHRKRRTLQGFTLVEMLMVLAIMSILFAAAGSGMKKAWQGQEIRASAIHLAHDLTLASQTAAKLNKPVEVRFYKYRDPRVAHDKPQYFAWQLLTQEPSDMATKNKAVPLYEVQRCEGTTLISEHRIGSSVCSTVLGQSSKPDKNFDPDVGIGEYEYVSVEYSPSGRTNLDPDAHEQWTLTMIPMTYADKPGEMPKEFQVLGIDARSGGVRIW